MNTPPPPVASPVITEEDFVWVREVALADAPTLRDFSDVAANVWLDEEDD